MGLDSVNKWHIFKNYQKTCLILVASMYWWYDAVCKSRVKIDGKKEGERESACVWKCVWEREEGGARDKSRLNQKCNTNQKSTADWPGKSQPT